MWDKLLQGKVMNITPTTYYTVKIFVGGIILVIMLLMVIFMMEYLATLVTDQVGK